MKNTPKFREVSQLLQKWNPEHKSGKKWDYIPYFCKDAPVPVTSCLARNWLFIFLFFVLIWFLLLAASTNDTEHKFHGLKAFRRWRNTSWPGEHSFPLGQVRCQLLSYCRAGWKPSAALYYEKKNLMWIYLSPLPVSKSLQNPKMSQFLNFLSLSSVQSPALLLLAPKWLLQLQSQHPQGGEGEGAQRENPAWKSHIW